MKPSLQEKLKTLDKKEKERKDSMRCGYLNPFNGKIKCENLSIKTVVYCPFIANENVWCPIKDLIFGIPCCPRCNYKMTSYLRDLKSNEVICEHCRSRFSEKDITTYKELIIKKGINKLRRVWFTH